MRTRDICLTMVVVTSTLAFSASGPRGRAAAAPPPVSAITEVPLPDTLINDGGVFAAELSGNSRFALARSGVVTTVRTDLATGVSVDLPSGWLWSKMSSDGRYVLDFSTTEIIRHDITTGADLHIAALAGLVLPGTTYAPDFEITDVQSISADGNRIAFQVSSNASLTSDVIVYDVAAANAYQATSDVPPTLAIGSGASHGSLSADGRFLAFAHTDGPGLCIFGAHCYDIWVKDFTTGALTPVSIGADGGLSTAGPSTKPVIASGGEAVVFMSTATDLVSPPTLPGETNLFVWTRATNSIVRIVPPAGMQLDLSSPPAITADGQLVGFTAENGVHRAAMVADLHGGTTVLMDMPWAAQPEGLAGLSADGNLALVVSAKTDPSNPVYTPRRLYKVSLVAANAYHPLAAPARLLDTRPGTKTVDGQFAGTGLRPGTSVLELDVAGRGGVPGDAAAVALNVTVTQPTAAGFVTVYPCGVDIPAASNLNFVAGDTIPNAVIAKLGTNGRVCLYTNVATHLIVDVTGYFG